MSARTKAFVNFYAAMGTLEKYVELDPAAKEIASRQDLTIRFKVKDGPDGLIVFEGGKVSVVPNDERKTNILLYCASPEQFNSVVDGKGQPLPLKGLFKTLSFMGKPESPFNKLTNEMTVIMRSQKRSDGSDAKELSILLSFYAMCAALAEIGNQDEIGKLSGARIPEGEISVEIKDKAYVTIVKKDGKLACKKEKSQNPRAFMVFNSIDIAGDLITGKVDAMTCLSRGDLVMKGYIPMLDNLNKVLNLVPKYLS